MREIIKVTPHPIRFQAVDGTAYEIPPSGIAIGARVEEESAGPHPTGAALIRTRFVADAGALQLLDDLERTHPGALVGDHSSRRRRFRGESSA